MTRNGLFLSVALAVFLGSAPAEAGVMSRDWSVTIAGGPFDGQIGTGTFQFDADLLSGMGSETIGPVGSFVSQIQDPNFRISLSLFGLDLNEMNDIDFNDFPTLRFLNGSPTFIDYILTQGINGVDFEGLGIQSVEIVSTLTDNNDVFNAMGTVTLGQVVPEPTSWLVFSGLLLGGTTVRRRRR